MKINTFSLVTLVGISLVTPALAIVTIDYVSVGNAGNAADTVVTPDGSGLFFGAVSYAYNIGKYEVTNAQYGEFLNAKGASNSNDIYNANMASSGITQNNSSGNFTYSVTGGFENKPVIYVSWYDAARFANWLLNGQGSGDMETGAYTLNGNLDIINKNVGAAVWIPSENEWYKAAYYQGNGTYSLYPNGQNSITYDDANWDFTNVGERTDVGAYVNAPSFYGTFDQGGNVWEWNDAVISGSSRGLRGGSWDADDGAPNTLASSYRDNDVPMLENNFAVGFRVASVPEPTSLVLSMLASGAMLLRRKR